MNRLNLIVSGVENTSVIPDKFTFSRYNFLGGVGFEENISPMMSWSGVPAEAQSLVLMVVDLDTNVKNKFSVNGYNLESHFCHLVLTDIPTHICHIPEGSLSHGVVVGGKPIGKMSYGVMGANDFTGFFEHDKDMRGVYGGYDGCSPLLQEKGVHHYAFRLYALNKRLGLRGNFSGHDALHAMVDSILAVSEVIGLYSMSQMSTLAEKA